MKILLNIYTDTTTVTTSESTLTFANSRLSIGNSCTYCFIYIITGSVVGISTLLVVCTLLFALMICIIIHSNKNDTSSCDYGVPDSPVYKCIPNPAGRCLNPTVTSVMTENEAYNTCSEEISAYDIV